MTNPTTVSVIIPSFNQGRFIAETLDSVFTQDYSRLEVLVMDGGSQDETVEILRRYDGKPGFHWISEPDRGVVDAVNKGLARATGPICGILSSDDCYSPGAVSAAVSHLEQRTDLVLVYADAEYIDEVGTVTGRTQVEDYSFESLLARRTFIIQSSAFFRTELARQCGGWRPEVSYVADNDLWLQLAMKGPMERLRGIWSRYRFHGAQRDTQSQRIVRDWNRAIEDCLPRLSPSQRRAARVGCHLTAHRYASAGDWWFRTKSLYAAVASDPRCILWSSFPRVELLQPVRQVLSRVKRTILRRPTESGSR